MKTEHRRNRWMTILLLSGMSVLCLGTSEQVGASEQKGEPKPVGEPETSAVDAAVASKANANCTPDGMHCWGEFSDLIVQVTVNRVWSLLDIELQPLAIDAITNNAVCTLVAGKTVRVKLNGQGSPNAAMNHLYLSYGVGSRLAISVGQESATDETCTLTQVSTMYAQ